MRLRQYGLHQRAHYALGLPLPRNLQHALPRRGQVSVSSNPRQPWKTQPRHLLKARTTSLGRLIHRGASVSLVNDIVRPPRPAAGAKDTGQTQDPHNPTHLPIEFLKPLSTSSTKSLPESGPNATGGVRGGVPPTPGTKYVHMVHFHLQLELNDWVSQGSSATMANLHGSGRKPTLAQKFT